MQTAGRISYMCNVCGTHQELPAALVTRESTSCAFCRSSARMRSIVRGLSVALYGQDLALPDFPQRSDIRGYGMSDWPGYARRLGKVLDYRNTYYHQAPRLDITHIDTQDEGTLDFLISTDVYEHIVPPVQPAFVNARRLLKPHGFMVFSVPYISDMPTQEHFPELWDFRIEEDPGGDRKLRNTTRDGRQQVFHNLVFHGGPGSTLEMRVFGLGDLLRNLEDGGFAASVVLDQPAYARGIFWSEGASFPLVAFVDASDAQRFREALRATNAVHLSDLLADADWGPQHYSPAQVPTHLWVRGQNLGLVPLSITLDGRRLSTDVSPDGTLISATIPPEAFAAGAALEVSLSAGARVHRLGQLNPTTATVVLAHRKASRLRHLVQRLRQRARAF